MLFQIHGEACCRQAGERVQHVWPTICSVTAEDYSVYGAIGL